MVGAACSTAGRQWRDGGGGGGVGRRSEQTKWKDGQLECGGGTVVNEDGAARVPGSGERWEWGF